ncbi:MAG: hypothetical protein HYU77_04855 [Betaproteobacteria bacterium]|nr:hypothetical protein [Betaproteobacteria bacterium]
MERQQAREILQALANGIDPHTGEVLQGESVFQQPDTIRALFTAIEFLKSPDPTRAGERTRLLPEQTGKAWSPEEEAVLGAAFDAGESIAELAQKHRRTRGGIRARLIRLGRIVEAYPTQRAEPTAPENV